MENTGKERKEIMKKFICVIVLVAVTLGLGIAETVYSSQLYKDLNLRLIEINEDISAAADNGDFSKAAAKTDDVIALWEKNKKLALMITNHSTIRVDCLRRLRGRESALRSFDRANGRYDR